MGTRGGRDARRPAPRRAERAPRAPLSAAPDPHSTSVRRPGVLRTGRLGGETTSLVTAALEFGRGVRAVAEPFVGAAEASVLDFPDIAVDDDVLRDQG